MSDESLNLTNPSDEKIGALRRSAVEELERISQAEFAQRLKVPLDDLLRFLAGDHPDRRLLIALSVYDFGRYPDLAQLMSARFYESYDYDTGGWERWEPAVDGFAREETPGRVAGAAGDITRFLADVQGNDQVREQLSSLGCRFSFNAIEMSPREWLMAVHDRLLSTAGLSV